MLLLPGYIVVSNFCHDLAMISTVSNDSLILSCEWPCSDLRAQIDRGVTTLIELKLDQSSKFNPILDPSSHTTS
jgi:hypothetical protein